MGNLCSSFDGVDRDIRTDRMLYASEPAPAYTPADRFAQLQVAHSCEQKRSSHSSSPERRQYRDAPTVVGGFAQEQQPQQQQHLHQQQEAPGGEDQWRIPATPCTAPPPLDDSQARQQQYEQEEEDVVLDEPFSWKKGELIGIGAFGRVFSGLNNHTGELVAVKQVSFAKDEALQGRVVEHIRALEAEVAVLKTLKHENIVQYLGTESTEDAIHIFLEFVPGGSIASLLAKFGPFQESVIRLYTRQILRGLEYLHQRGIMHRDIKGANILVDKCGQVKLADFGASKKIEDLATVGSGCKSIRGTPYWMAPEVIKQTGHGRPADIWSVGCTVIEMATGKPPWSNYAAPVAAMFQIASSKDPPPIPDNISPEAKDFLLLCFNRVPRERANATRLLKHPFVANISPKEQQQQQPSTPQHRGQEGFNSSAAANSALTPQRMAGVPGPSYPQHTSPPSPSTEDGAHAAASRQQQPHQQSMLGHGSPSRRPELGKGPSPRMGSVYQRDAGKGPSPRSGSVYQRASEATGSGLSRPPLHMQQQQQQQQQPQQPQQQQQQPVQRHSMAQQRQSMAQPSTPQQQHQQQPHARGSIAAGWPGLAQQQPGAPIAQGTGGGYGGSGLAAMAEHDPMACTLVNWNPVEEPSWMPEGGPGAGPVAAALRRHTSYGDDRDELAQPPAAAATAAPAQQPQAGGSGQGRAAGGVAAASAPAPTTSGGAQEVAVDGMADVPRTGPSPVPGRDSPTKQLTLRPHGPAAGTLAAGKALAAPQDSDSPKGPLSRGHLARLQSTSALTHSSSSSSSSGLQRAVAQAATGRSGEPGTPTAGAGGGDGGRQAEDDARKSKVAQWESELLEELDRHRQEQRATLRATGMPPQFR